MDETVLFPSPNWFQASALVVSRDNWLVYGGPTKSLCVLEPLAADHKRIIQGPQGYHSHVVNRAHPEKIVCIDLSPGWPEKKAFLTGSQDGLVKQWVLERAGSSMAIRSTHSHEIHCQEKEEVVGVGYCNDGYAITIGSYGHIVKWDLSSNVVKTYNKVLKGFRPTSVACSPHINLNVAVGTKQGVVFVLDLNGAARVLYKVRGQDDEITKVGWCPQYEVAVRKMLKESTKEPVASGATLRMEKIRQQPEHPDFLKALDKRVQESVTEDKPIQINEKLEPVETTSEVASETEARTDAEITPDSADPTKLSEETKAKRVQESVTKDKPIQFNEKLEPVETTSDMPSETEPKTDAEITPDSADPTKLPVETKAKEPLNVSGLAKTLPEDSFDETMVLEDDMFDIYKDHESDEFGHKKFEPQDIVVKVTEDIKQDDYLVECQKLKEEILKRKNESEQSIDALVDALDKTHVEMGNTSSPSTLQSVEATATLQQSADATAVPQQSADAARVSQINTTAIQGKITKGEVEYSVHIHKHLLATIGKHGSVRVWSKSGKMVGSCVVQGSGNKNQRNQRNATTWTTLLWYQPEVLLLADARSQLLECNPLMIDCKNKLEWKLVHALHKRGLFAIASNAPRVQPPDMAADRSRDTWLLWTTSQDRNLICYSMKQRGVVSEHHTCGGYLYTIRPCPYDSRKIAISVGDGAVRVWETDTADDDDTKLTAGQVVSYWQNVQGKVLTVAWHPTRENLLAFATAESRVGLIDTGKSKSDKPAKVFPPALSGGVYSLCWGEEGELYACGSGGELMRYHCDRPDDAPVTVEVSHEGQKWSVSSVQWFPRGLVCGSDHGGVAVLAPAPGPVLAAAFVFSKMIHNVDWHPQETSNSDGESPHKNLLAVCSLDKSNNIVILEYGDNEAGEKQLCPWKTLSGHTAPVLEVAWSPHAEGMLLSTSQDSTVRIWSATEGACVSIFGGHSQSALGAAWSPFPQQGSAVLSGGGDCCLRLWDYTDHPPDTYEELKYEVVVKKKKNKTNDQNKKEWEKSEDAGSEENQTAALLEAKTKASKKFLLPLTYKQMNPCKIDAVRWIFSLYCMQRGNSTVQIEPEQKPVDVDFIKIFGTTKELCELLDDEAERLQDTGCVDSWIMLNIVRGYMDAIYAYAAEKDLLDPYLISIAPCVSFKYWKEVTMLYLAQIDRLMAKGQEVKLYESKLYGGPIYRKVGVLLSLHDVSSAVRVLVEAQLYKEAYILCRTRYDDDLAKDTLQQWAHSCDANGTYNMAAICYIALGDVEKAATVLGKSSNEQALYTAGSIAKVIGQTSFSKHCFDRCKEIEKNASQSETVESTEILETLPSRAELVLKENIDIDQDNRESDSSVDKLKECANNDRKVIEEQGDQSQSQTETETSETRTTEDKVNKTDNESINSVKAEVEPNPDLEEQNAEIVDKSAVNAVNDVKTNEESVKEASDVDKTDEMLEDLPSKMEGLKTVDKKCIEEEHVELNGAGDAQMNGTQDVTCANGDP